MSDSEIEYGSYESVRQSYRDAGQAEWQIRSNINSYEPGSYNGGRYTTEYLSNVAQSILNGNPNYDSVFSGNIPGSAPMETYLKSGEFYSRARNAKGQVGRVLSRGFDEGIKSNNKLIDDIRRVLIASLIENYDQKVISHTGVGRQAISEGSMDIDDQAIGYVYEIADLPGQSNVSAIGGESYGERPSTQEYLPIVFQGRAGIVSAARSMRFVAYGRWFNRRIVGPAEPRNIFELTSSQLNNISEVILRGINPQIQEWLDNYGA